MKLYADTSFLYSYYSADANSLRADLWRQKNVIPLPWTVLHRLEFRNALELAVFQQRATVGETAQTWQTVELDIAGGLITESAVPLADLYREAESLAIAHTSATGARSLDILHVAAARLLGADELVTFDQRQGVLASRAGLLVAIV